MDPRELTTRNPFSWLKEAISSNESHITAIFGVDTAVYFVFLSTVLKIMVVSSVILLPLLLPLAATDTGTSTTTSIGTFNELDKLSVGHVQENSPRLWGFAVGVYWVSVASYYFLWKAYIHVSELRASALTGEAKVEQFAVVVRDIPPLPQGLTRKEQVDSYFTAMYPHTFYRSILLNDNTKVEKIWEELEGCKKKLRRAEAVYAQSKTKLTSSIGFLGLIGDKVDTIDYMTNKIAELTSTIETERKHTIRDKKLNSAVVFFTYRVTGAAAAQSLHARMADRWTVISAPEPRQLIWSSLSLNFYARQARQCVVYAVVALTILFYMIPIGLISALTTLENLVKLMPLFKPLVDVGVLRTVLEAYLPHLALIVFLSLLPKLLMHLSKTEGIISISHATRAASGKYFYFTVLNVFIGVTIGGTLFSTSNTIENNPNNIIDVLASSLPSNAMFFLIFVALKFFVGYGLELSRLVPLIIYHLKRKYICKTEEDLREAWSPGGVGYATRFPGDMLVLTLVLCYSVIAPLIIPFGVAYFGLGWLVLRNQVLKVYVPSYESNGRMWPHIHTRVVGALMLYQLTMLGYFGVKKFHYTPILIPLPIITLIFALVCKDKFYRFFQNTALEVVCSNELREAPNMDQVFQSFIPPCLLQLHEKQEEDEFEDATFAFSRSSPYV
ncbi:hypothetical protein V2J09_004400 [Rumex salicifolius]